MNKKTTGIVAGVAGAALLMGGATFALWNDSATVEAGHVTAGNLDLGDADVQWWDVSDDRTDDPQEISLDTFRIIPGDTIRGTFTIPAALEGDNMLAKLSIGRIGGDLDFGLVPALIEGSSVKVSLGDEEVTIDHGVLEDEGLFFASKDNVLGTDLPQLPSEIGTGGDPIEVEVELTFKDVDEDDFVGLRAGLKDFDVTLTQVRAEDAPGQGGYNG